MNEVLSYTLKPSQKPKFLFNGFNRFYILISSIKPLKHKLLIFFIALLIILMPSKALGDIVIPTFMIFLPAIPAIPYLLIIIIILEAWVGVKIINMNWNVAIQISIVANLVSTLCGIPFTYIVFGGVAGYFYGITSKGGLLHTISKYLLQPFVWYPGMDRWVYPLSIFALFLLMFFATVLIEQYIAKEILKKEHNGAYLAKKWSRLANIASYSLFFIVGISWFLMKNVF